MSSESDFQSVAPPVEVEPEDTESGRDVSRPWDPSLIRVDPKTFSLRQILDMIDDGDLDLAPDFQRHQVWGPTQKSRLIESILLRIPLPAFYFSADKDGRMQVVDGLQRLSTVHGFARDEFGLDHLEYLQEQLAGKRFSEIKDTGWGRRLNTTQIAVNVIDPQTPAKVKFDIFKRINTLGEPLTAQEIRHCMSQARSRGFLKTCANSEAFLRATSGSLRDHKRMADRESVLRFCAFRLLGDLEGYDHFESMDVFLTDATEKLDTSLDDETLRQLAADLERAADNAARIFGPQAFRKWPAGAPENGLNPISKPLLEAWTVALADFTWDEIEPRREAIVAAARAAMRDDRDFLDAVSTGTGDPRKVKIRFRFVRALVERTGTAAPLPGAAELAQPAAP